MRQKKLLIIPVLFFSSFLLAQTAPLPSDHPVAMAAPHLPLIQKYDGIGKAFFGEKNTYKKENNETYLKGWIKAYPEELTKYKDVISTYLKSTSVETLSLEQAALYYDLKSQYLMIRQIVNW